LEKHIEQIECPECGKIQIATVLHTLPFWSYVHNCVSCKYTIMESEWILIKKEDELKQIDLKNETANGTKTVLADSAIQDALSTLLRVGASMVTTGISGEISEWKLPKTTPLKAKRKIVQEADKWNDVNRRRAIELKNAYDVLSRHFR